MFAGMNTVYATPEKSNLEIMILKKEADKLMRSGLIHRDNVSDTLTDSFRIIVKNISYLTVLKIIKLMNIRFKVNDEWVYVKHDDLQKLDRLYKETQKENKPKQTAPQPVKVAVEEQPKIEIPKEIPMPVKESVVEEVSDAEAPIDNGSIQFSKHNKKQKH